jgi:CheY-like chemotaxis protein
MEKKIILVVDDEENTRRLLEVALSNSGYQVNTAKNGNEALEYLSGHVPDAIVCDIVMPDMDGYSLIRKVKDNPGLREVPFIFSSGKGGMKDYFELEDEVYRPDAFLIKPYKMKLLVEKVNEVIK